MSKNDTATDESTDLPPTAAGTLDDTEIIEAGDDGEVLDESSEAGRPDNCDCGEWNADAGLACWPCYRDGFNTPPEDADL